VTPEARILRDCEREAKATAPWSRAATTSWGFGGCAWLAAGGVEGFVDEVAHGEAFGSVEGLETGDDALSLL